MARGTTYTCTYTAARGSPPMLQLPHLHYLSTPVDLQPKHADSTPQRSHMQAPAHMQHCSLIALAGTRKSHEAQQRTHSTRSGKPKPQIRRQAIGAQAHANRRHTTRVERTCTYMHMPMQRPGRQDIKSGTFDVRSFAHTPQRWSLPKGATSAARLPRALPTHLPRGPLHGNRRTTLNTHPQARDPSLTCPSPRGNQHPYGSLGGCLRAGPPVASRARTF